jgi:hypothetical protein
MLADATDAQLNQYSQEMMRYDSETMRQYRQRQSRERFVKTSGLRWICVVLVAEVKWASSG